MMKISIKHKMKIFLSLIIVYASFFLTSHALAALLIIGEAKYLPDNNYYKLIYDNDVNGIPLTWLDFTCQKLPWYLTKDEWVYDLGASLEIALYPEYTSDIDWGVGWRLPLTVDGEFVKGYDGTTTGGYNITSSEMGQLFYDELNNIGSYDVNGQLNDWDDVLMNDTGPFDNLYLAFDGYWSDTTYSILGNCAWQFEMLTGFQSYLGKESYDLYGIAVHPGPVYARIPTIPIPATMLLLGAGLVVLAGLGGEKIFKKG